MGQSIVQLLALAIWPALKEQEKVNLRRTCFSRNLGEAFLDILIFSILISTTKQFRYINKGILPSNFII
jgi:hypothetical protein